MVIIKFSSSNGEWWNETWILSDNYTGIAEDIFKTLKKAQLRTF